jgi:hypothetical protein
VILQLTGKKRKKKRVFYPGLCIFNFLKKSLRNKKQQTL